MIATALLAAAIVSSLTIDLGPAVRSWAEREVAQQAAWGAPGVTAVENQITVTP